MSTMWYQPTCVMVMSRPDRCDVDAVSLKRLSRAPPLSSSDGGLSNGFDVTDATFGTLGSIGWLYEHRMVSTKVCDGHKPVISPLNGR
jgi:hypothetical protein